MNGRDIQAALNFCGFGASWISGVYRGRLTEDGNIGNITKEAVSRFQACINLNDDPALWLAIDGNPGDQTQKALAKSKAYAGLVSPNFHASELACKHCWWIDAKRELLHADERYRAVFDP